MKFEIKKKVIKPLCIYSLAFSMLLPSVASLADLDINLGGYSVVYADAVKAPTVNPVFYDATTISGGNLAKARINKKLVIATVHVSLKDSSGTEKANLSVTPTSGTTWKVDLPGGKKVAKGDTVTVYQQIGEDKSTEVTANAQASKASTVTLTMPTGEIWVEQYVANIVNADEKAEAIDLLKKANPTIAKDIKSVEFKITGIDTKTASYVVTYTDDSKTEEIQAPDLTIKKVTDTSRSPEIGSITIVDKVVKGKLPGPGPFDGIKVQLILRVNKDKAGQYCNENKCTVDKDSSNPIGVTLQNDGSFSYTLEGSDKLELDQIVGVSVKEPHKFVSCSTTTVKPVTVEKQEVRDPRKLTAEDKKAIDAAIRTAYTVDGVSKLPNGYPNTDYQGLPAVIQIDDSGNVKIFDATDAIVSNWDDAGNAIPDKNPDGSVKLNDGAQPKITIPAKDLLKNIKPEAPTLALSKDKKNITITPNLEVDTDAKIITVSYKDKDGKDQTTTATKDDNGTWSIVGEGTVLDGVITLPKNKVKGGEVVTAIVTDKGGVAEDDKKQLTSDPGTLTLEETKADKVETLGGLAPVDIKKWVGDDIDWKKGVKAKDDAKKDEVAELLKGAKFEDVTEEKRSTTKEGDFTGKVKVTFDDDSEIIVEKQMLYVSNLVTSEKRENTPDDALVVEFKLGEGTKVDNTGSGAIEGNKDPVSYQKYKVKPNTNLKDYKLPNLNASVVDSIKVTPQEGYTEAKWNTEDFVATDSNKVFTATATKTFKVTVQPNGGTGDDKVETKKSGEKYTLPKGDTFNPPENQKFAGWLVGDTTTTTEPGTEITITGDTVIKASWKPIELKVNFLPGTGAGGEMKDVPVNKGSDYKLPEPTFTPPPNQQFAGWKVGNEDGVKEAGETIKITDNVTLTATWKDIMVNVSYNANGGSGKMEGKELKKGSTYKLLDNGFTAPENQEFKAWEVDGKEVAPGTEITVDKDTKIKAIWKDTMVNVSYDANGGSGEMAGAIQKKGSKYTLSENSFKAPNEKQEFKAWEVNGKEVAAGTEITLDKDTKIKAIWKDIEFKVSFDGNTGTGSMDTATVKKGEKYKLPENTFGTPPDKQKFKTWEVDGKEVAPGTEITVEKDTVVKAIWEGIEYKVRFDGNGGTGSMDTATVKKGEKYKLPENTFGAPSDKQEFKTWEIDGKEVAPGTEITVDKDIEVKATWKTKPGTDEPGTKPEEPSYEEYEIPGIKIRDHYTPTFPVYAVVPKTEKVEKLEEVPVSLETHKAYIAGYEDNTLRAEGNITRAEAAAMVTRLAGLDLSDNSMPAFKDMQKNAWYFRYINAAVKANMLDADNGMMRPNDKITRAEFAKMLAAIDKENSSVSKFDDIKGHRYEKEINKIYGNNRIEGYEDGSFRPDAYLTRAESAAFLNRMFNRIADKVAYAGLEDNLARFKDFDSSKWYYDEMVEATNSHELTRRGKASDKYGRVYEKWTRILPSDVK